MPSKDARTAVTKLRNHEYAEFEAKAKSQNLSVCAALKILAQAYLRDEIEIKSETKMVVVTHK